MASGGGGTIHAHGCTECHAYYEDVCERPDEDVPCATCVRGAHRAWDWGAMEPRDCCFVRGNVEQMVSWTDAKTRAMLMAARLRGVGPWYRCTQCSRRFPHHRPSRDLVHGRLTAWHVGKTLRLFGTPPEWVMEDLERRALEE